jgi:DNA-binding MarR family transcriptional regulator
MTGIDLDAYLPYRLSVASNKVSALIAKAYEARFGLTIPQWRLLVILAEGEAMSQKALIERSAMDKVTISRAVAALVGRGLLLKQSRTKDRRLDSLTLTRAGREIVADVVPVALGFEAALVEALGVQAARDMTIMLRALEERAEALSKASATSDTRS